MKKPSASSKAIRSGGGITHVHNDIRNFLNKDYVRAGTVCKSSNDLFLTGKLKILLI